ncbi:MAG: Ig-like domain-containing protein [Bifidobacteriaceae bacterium]|nr:Ig-like domain-containing protein [Bifidobacteriaceae bacterium]
MTFQSSKPRIATVSTSGTVRAKRTGTGTITVKVGTVATTITVTMRSPTTPRSCSE